MELTKNLVRDVPDFPKKGILFRDLTPVLENGQAFGEIVAALESRYKNKGITKIVGIESRGFIFGAPLAHVLGCGFAIVRKPGKLPMETYSASYDLEYGQDTVHLHRDALGPEDVVVIVDDLIATGGTAKAAYELVSKCKAKTHELCFVIELAALNGRKKLKDLPVHALLTY